MVTLAHLARDVAEPLLAAMRQPTDNLYSNKLVVVDGTYRNRGVNSFYSAIAVLGLLEAERQELLVSSDTAVAETLESLCRQLVTCGHPGTVSILAWALALRDDVRAGLAYRQLETMVSPAALSTMELGLALAAVSEVVKRTDRLRDTAARFGGRLAEELRNRYEPRGAVFRGFGPRLSMAAAKTSRMTSFASQVYPVHGLCLFARALDLPPGREVAEVCRRLCQAQGEQGQWWWFYDLRRMQLMEGYPVYSVHQDAMAFMALLAAEEVGAGSYRPALSRGLEWLYGRNELGLSMVSTTPPMIHRAIQRRGGDPDGFAGWSRRQRLTVGARSLGAARATAAHASPAHLEVLEECRSYHPGWLLYAAAFERRLSGRAVTGAPSTK
jgi:hypothetical protein